MTDCENICGKIITTNCLKCSVHEKHKQVTRDNNKFKTIMYMLNNKQKVNLGL